MENDSISLVLTLMNYHLPVIRITKLLIPSSINPPLISPLRNEILISEAHKLFNAWESNTFHVPKTHKNFLNGELLEPIPSLSDRHMDEMFYFFLEKKRCKSINKIFFDTFHFSCYLNRPEKEINTWSNVEVFFQECSKVLLRGLESYLFTKHVIKK